MAICRDYYIMLAVPINDFQPILYKICVNLQKRMLSLRSTKVPLGSNLDFNILDNISEWDLGTPGGIGPYIEKTVHHYGLCKIKYS